VKRTNNDLIVGGVIFISLFILIAGGLGLKQMSVSRKMVAYTVLFSNVGTLQKGDPVTVNGVKRGSVSKLYLHKSQVAIEIKLDKEVVFTDSSKVAVQNIGLMGERMVGILLSDKGKPYVPDSKNKITYIRGYFDSGIAEAVGLLGEVLTEVLVLIDTVERIIEQTVGDTNFIDFFNTLVHRLDTTVYLVESLVKENEREINQAIDNVHLLSADLKNILTENRANVDNILSNGSDLSNAALTIAARIDSIAATVNAIVTDLEAGKGSAGALLEDETIIHELKESLVNLDSLVNDIYDNGLKLRIKLFGNRKFFEQKEQKNK
jgi:phospholipid/cholesterol/gamma-HCH transport system substrate-binding protein